MPVQVLNFLCPRPLEVAHILAMCQGVVIVAQKDGPGAYEEVIALAGKDLDGRTGV